MTSVSDQQMKSKLIMILERQGYVVSGNTFSLPDSDRETKRQVHILSKAERVNEHYKFILSNADLIGKYIIDGKDLDINKIQPKLILVQTNTLWETLFRWWNLTWWSLPYERAYGRQLRFIVWDEYHKAPIGLIGLQSPLLSWGVRDKHLDLQPERRDYWINQSLNAQRLGALPPYNNILGGKLVALLMASNVVCEEYEKKYKRTKTILEKRRIPSRLLFITTTGAYGKSSIYNRLKYNDEYVAKFIGYSTGSGSFHIPNIFFEELLHFLESKDVNIRRGYGSGPSRKMRLIDTALNYLGFKNGVNHGIKRAVYFFPLVTNLQEIITQNASPVWYNRSVNDLTDYWKIHWAAKRIEKDKTYLSFNGKRYLKSELKNIDKSNKEFREFNKWISSK